MFSFKQLPFTGSVSQLDMFAMYGLFFESFGFKSLLLKT
jgi:hypothetical protein